MATKPKTPEEKYAAKQRQLAAIEPHKWKPGQSGNPAGPQKVSVQFFRYVVKFMEMTPAQIKRLDTKKLSMSEIGALAFVNKFGKGEWNQQREVIERELGKVQQNIGIGGPEGEPIKIYYGIDPDKI